METEKEDLRNFKPDGSKKSSHSRYNHSPRTPKGYSQQDDCKMLCEY